MSKQEKPIVFSGIQPSGRLMIGNYLGAIKYWVELQQQYDCIFSLVDLHTITVRQDPHLLRERCYDFLCLYIACGVDPDKSIVFVQSHVPAHAQLAWILNCYTYIGELNRMTQFKDKSKRYESNINAGLFDYPVLMAADILLYNTELVPVGEDQKQHLEMTRDIALRFNNLYGSIFTIPEPFIPPMGARIMSILDPSQKMSKSDSNPNNYIALLDEPDLIRQKMKRAVTDSGGEIRFLDSKPGISNLLTLYAAITDKAIPQLEQEYLNCGYGKFKSDLAEVIVEFLKPIQQHYKELRKDTGLLKNIFSKGAEQARSLAEKKLNQVEDVIGLIRAG